MAKAETRPKAKGAKAKENDTVAVPNAHDAPGLSPMERMTELTRQIINVPKDEADRAQKRRH
jgi:hypothetical protein